MVLRHFRGSARSLYIRQLAESTLHNRRRTPFASSAVPGPFSRSSVAEAVVLVSFRADLPRSDFVRILCGQLMRRTSDLPCFLRRGSHTTRTVLPPLRWSLAAAFPTRSAF